MFMVPYCTCCCFIYIFSFMQADRLKQAGYDFVILGFKENPKRHSVLSNGTDGQTSKFFTKYPEVVKLWRSFCRKHYKHAGEVTGESSTVAPVVEDSSVAPQEAKSVLSELMGSVEHLDVLEPVCFH